MATTKNKHTDSISLELLWEQFLSGNMPAFRKIYEVNYQPLYTFGLKYLSPDEVEDCIQNLFLYILQHRTSIAKVQNVKSYLFISYKNQITKTIKANKFIFEQISANLNIEQNSYSKEKILSEVGKFLQKLSPRENEIVHLKYYQNFKNIEIANSLGLEYQTVRNTLHNALNKLRKFPLQSTY